MVGKSTAFSTAKTSNSSMENSISALKGIQKQGLIGGKWVDAAKGKTFAVSNPASGAQIAEVADFGSEDITTAIDSAESALKAWQTLQPVDRGAILNKWAALIRENADDLAFLMTSEQGKPLAEAKGEILGSAGTIQWCAEEGRRLYGEFIDGQKAGTKIVISREPVGVVGAITPWNFPASMITRKVGPAIAAGCTVVLKPSEETPLCALALADLALKAGLPAGVLNIVPSTDAAMVGKVLTDDVRVRKISFTGSTRVGKLLMGQVAGNLQKISLELGGNAPFIVFPSADLEKAAEGAISSKFRNAGQTCICANRIFVHKKIFDEFLNVFSSKIKALRVGPGDEKNVTIGPLINGKAIEKIEKMIAEVIADGAKIHIGGKRHALGGTFFEPTLITGASPKAALAREEIFGPVAALYPFEDEDAVVDSANDTPYGLAAYIYSEDQKQVWRVSDRLKYGMVAVNEPLLATDLAPFGGVKDSGIGREGGHYGLLEYTDIKYRLFG